MILAQSFSTTLGDVSHFDLVVQGLSFIYPYNLALNPWLKLADCVSNCYISPSFYPILLMYPLGDNRYSLISFVLDNKP